jgi:hypothetical protein
MCTCSHVCGCMCVGLEADDLKFIYKSITQNLMNLLCDFRLYNFLRLKSYLKLLDSFRSTCMLKAVKEIPRRVRACHMIPETIQIKYKKTDVSAVWELKHYIDVEPRKLNCSNCCLPGLDITYL